MGIFFFVILACPIFVAAQGSADPYQGAFAGKDLRIELRATSMAAYSGTMQIQGQPFPVKARLINRQLTGTFSSGGQNFNFVATVQNGQMRLVSDGSEYILTREGEPVSNPLAARVTTTDAHEHPRGFSIRPAAGWTPQNNEQGVLLVPPGTTANNQEVYLAAIQDGYNPAEEAKEVQQLSQEFLQNGGQANRAGVREQFPGGASYYWEAADPNSGNMAGLKIYFSPSGTRANVIVAFGLASRIASRDSDLRQMLSSLRLVAPKPIAAGGGGPLADNTPLAQQWLRKLQGKMIRQFHASQGMSSDKRHFLNADGTYSFQSSSMVSVDVAGASGLSTGRNRLQGRWRIRDVGGEIMLQIQYNDGDTGRFRITQDARNWYMNGEKAFAVDPE